MAYVNFIGILMQPSDLHMNPFLLHVMQTVYLQGTQPDLIPGNTDTNTTTVQLFTLRYLLSVTKGRIQKLLKIFKIVKTYWPYMYMTIHLKALQ
jgi:hypothetical protein